MSARWLILADDLTGAADAAVAFARRGHPTVVRWDTTLPAEGTAVHAVDLGTRASSSADAAARHGDAVRRCHRPGQALFKKIDSTLRGQPAAEIAAIATALRGRGQPAWGLLAPANPPMRRIVRAGRVVVDGVPLEDTVTWKREHSYPCADLVAMVRSAGLEAISLPLADLRDHGSPVRDACAAAAASGHAAGTVLVSDAETDADLERLVAATRDFAPGFFIGTAGLATALAGAAPATPTARLTLEPTSRGTLVAVGTLAEVSREAGRRLAAREGGDLVRITPDVQAGGAGGEGLAATIGRRLDRGETVVALLDAPDEGDGTPDPQFVRDFAESLRGAFARMGALIVTGGDTASAVLARCAVHGLRMLDEIVPGMALAMTEGAIDVPVVTKPGAFGDADSLIRGLEALNALRQDL